MDTKHILSADLLPTSGWRLGNRQASAGQVTNKSGQSEACRRRHDAGRASR